MAMEKIIDENLFEMNSSMKTNGIIMKNEFHFKAGHYHYYVEM